MAFEERRGVVSLKRRKGPLLYTPQPQPPLSLSHPSLSPLLWATPPLQTHTHHHHQHRPFNTCTQIFSYSTPLSPVFWWWWWWWGVGLGFGERAEGWWGAQIRAFAPLTRERTHFYNHSGGMWGPTKSLQPQGDWSSVEPFQAVGRRARGTCSTGMKKKKKRKKRKKNAAVRAREEVLNSRSAAKTPSTPTNQTT